MLSFHLIMTDTPFYRRLLARNNLPLPPGTRSAIEAAGRALEMLPHGPVSNICQENNEAGYSPLSPDEIRARILMIDQMSRGSFGEGGGSS